MSSIPPSFAIYTDMCFVRSVPSLDSGVKYWIILHVYWFHSVCPLLFKRISHQVALYVKRCRGSSSSLSISFITPLLLCCVYQFQCPRSFSRSRTRTGTTFSVLFLSNTESTLLAHPHPCLPFHSSVVLSSLLSFHPWPSVDN